MALVNRVSRLFKADFHAVLDRIEEPDVLLRQAIREMQDDLASDEQELRGLKVEARQLQQREGELQQSIKQIEDELDICFEADKEDLARNLVRRKLEQQQRLQHTSKRQQQLQQQIADVESRLLENQQLLEAMQQKAECLLETQEIATSEFDQYMGSEFGVQDSDVEVAFLKEQQRRTS